MKVYVAAKWERKDDARACFAELRRFGHVITHDWTAEDDAGMTPGPEHDSYLAKCADLDVQGVCRADALIVLHHDALAGGLVEMGMALAFQDRPVIVVGAAGAARQPIFYRLPRVAHVATMEEAVVMLTRAVVMGGRLCA